VRTRFYSPAAILFILALSFSGNSYSQQTGAARRQPNNPSESSTSANTKASANSRVSSAVVKSDLSEALSVIQDNYIDGKKLDYNSIFKSSISGMLNVLDPHSTYLDAADFAAFKT
jgi:C-terminal processing protease CtpA/Prc